MPGSGADPEDVGPATPLPEPQAQALSDEPATVQQGDPAAVRLLVASSAIGFFLFGYDTGVVSGASDWAADDLHLTQLEHGICVGVTCIAAAISSIASGPLNARFGRKICIQISAAMFACGAAMIVISFGFATLALARATLGLAIGIATCTVPLYTAECVRPSERGKIIAFNDLCVALGQVSAGLTNAGCRYLSHSWRLSMGLAALPAVAQLVLFRFLPESPRWLALRGRVDEAARIFTMFHGSAEEAADELQHMEETAARVGAEKGFCEMWRHPSHRRALYVGVVMMVMNQASGINTVMYYSASILESAGFSEEAAIWGALLCNVTQSLGVCVSIYYMERWGRRFLAISSALAVAPSIAFLGLSFVLQAKPVAVAALAAYLFSFGLGLSGVPWTVNAEIYPLSIRSKGQSQAIFTNWFLNGIIALCFPLAVEGGPEYFFFAFCGVALLGAVWMYLYMPETKGLTLEEIERLFDVPLRQSARASRSGHAVMDDAAEMGDVRQQQQRLPPVIGSASAAAGPPFLESVQEELAS